MRNIGRERNVQFLILALMVEAHGYIETFVGTIERGDLTHQHVEIAGQPETGTIISSGQ